MILFVHCGWVQKGNGDLCGLLCGCTEQASRTTLCIFFLGTQRRVTLLGVSRCTSCFHFSLCRKKEKEEKRKKDPRFPVETGLIIPISRAGDCLSWRELCLQCPVSRERRMCDSLCLVRPSLNPGVPESLFPTDCMSQGCHTRLPEIRWVWAIETYSLMVLQTTSPRSTADRAVLPPESPGKLLLVAFEGPGPSIFSSALCLPLHLFQRHGIPMQDEHISRATVAPPLP